MSASCENEDYDEDDFTLFEIVGELTINGTKYYVGQAYCDKDYYNGGIQYELRLYESKKSVAPEKTLIIRDEYHNKISEYGSGITIDCYEGILVRYYGDMGYQERWDIWDVISGKISVAPSGKDIKIQLHNLKFKNEDDKSINYVVNGTATAMLDGSW